MPSFLTRVNGILSKLSFCSILVICGLLLYDLGWAVPWKHQIYLKVFYITALGAHLISVLGLIFTDKKKVFSIRQRIVQCTIAFALLLIVYNQDALFHAEHVYSPQMVNALLTIILIAIPFFASISHFMAWITQGGRKTLPPSLLFLLTLTCLAIVGSFLLMMPNCSYAQEGIPYIDALFISSSAVCVTGLSTLNVAEVLTPFGLIVLISLVQLGGFGIMSFAYFVAMVLGQGFSLKDKVLIKDLISEENLQSSTSFLKGIIIFTLTVELIGAAIIWFAWKDVHASIPGNEPLFWHAIFHSITSFCNAGFSTLPDGMSSDFIATNRISQSAIMLLIICGGFGYAIFKEIGTRIKHKFTRHHYNIRWTTHFTLAVKTSLFLIIAGAVVIFAVTFFEGKQDIPWYTTLWESLFNSVSARTAGININHIAAYPTAVALFICALMMIGGSPGGTAGGVRVTTFAVVLGEIWRILKERRDVEFNGRSIARDVVERSIAVVVISVSWVGVFTMITCYFEPGMEPLDLFFENVSAFSTTGFSRGVTPFLSEQSKILMIINMIAGRVGIFFFLVALVGRPSPKPYRFPSTKLPLN